MVTLADSLKSSSGRPLLLRKRADLTSERARYQGQNYWVVKEPIGLKYYRFQEEEYYILQMMDGAVSLDEIKDRFEKRFTPQKITLQDLQHFIGTLHRGGLVTSKSAGQGEQLKRRYDERKRKERMAQWTNILAIRFKGFDPEWILNRLLPWTRWFFHPFVQFFVLSMGVSAALLILVQFDTFQNRLPAFHEFFGPKNWLLLAVVLGCTKILHEFGHGLSCKFFGGECHEIGVMFLVLTPCLYCNVSDCWMLPNKWKRAAIGAAGMYVEVVLASAATFIWWWTEPGLLNHVCLQIMFVCSVSTILFNGNPLLRYDGYYILSDIVEIPNLRQKSSTILNQMMAKGCLGLELPEQPFLPQRNRGFFALYTVAAVAYRWLVLISILLFLNKVFEPYGLKIIGQTIAVFSIGTMLGKPFWSLYKFMTVPGRMHQVKRKNLSITVAVVAVLAAFLLFFPLPRGVDCPVHVVAKDAQTVYIEAPGRLGAVHVSLGKHVEQGAPLATLKSTDLELELVKLESELQVRQVQLTNLQRQSFGDDEALDQVASTEQVIASLEKQLEKKRELAAKLQLKAPVGGTVLPVARKAKEPANEHRLQSWSGRPTDPSNLGATIVDRIPFCEIGDPNRLEVAAVIDQTDIEMVETQQTVEIMLEAFPGRVLTGQVESVIYSAIDAVPKFLSNQGGGKVPTTTDKDGITRPMSASYEARIALDVPPELLEVGLRGEAQILTGREPLARRAWRYLQHTFHFSL